MPRIPRRPGPYERLDALARPDKWVLSDAGKLIFAPSFPRFVREMGLWDEAHFYNYPIERLFAASLLHSSGRQIPLLSHGPPSWRPDGLRRTFESPDGAIQVVETLRMEQGQTIQAEWTTSGPAHGQHLMIWTAWGTDAVRDGNRLRSATAEKTGLEACMDLHLDHLHQTPLSVTLNYRCDMATGGALMESQGRALIPAWSMTPFFDESNEGPFPTGGSHELADPSPEGHVYAALHVPLEDTSRVALRLTIDDGRTTRPSRALGTSWQDFYARAPSFSCSNPHIETFFDYRLFGLRMNALPGGAPGIPLPAICEGPAYFRAPISYSAQCHMLETRWLDGPEAARGSLLNFVHNQQADGRFVGYLGALSYPDEFFYHADWGLMTAVDDVHPDPDFLTRSIAALTNYVAHFDRERDPEGGGLYDIRNHYETGQEYMHRYVTVDEHADRTHWGDVFRLKGVDVSVYLYRIKQGIAIACRRLGRRDEADEWDARASRTGVAILEQMWDPDREMFFDINPHTGMRTQVEAAVCFYPYLTDLVDETHLPGFRKNLFDPARFWTRFPVPSSSVQDPFFDPNARWKGRRVNCPWNGRVWPMTNSHIAEAIALSAIRFEDAALRTSATELITRNIEMMCFDGNPMRPNSFEHYHPFSGRASEYRGIDDYQHSWILDLIVKYVCGVRPGPTLVVDPFPFDLEYFHLDALPCRGHRLTVSRQGSHFEVAVDGRPSAHSTLGTPVSIELT